MTTISPYGSWTSPITTSDLARGGVRLGFPDLVARPGDRPDVWWSEGRPAEGGRQVIVSQARGDLLPAPFNARTRVHEYGGLAWLALPARAGAAADVEPSLIFAEWSDQRLYRIEPGSSPQPVTPEPPTKAGWRYADFILSADGREIWCVREEHSPDGEVSRAIVAVPIDGSAAADPTKVRIVVAGSQFYAWPRVSPDGRRIAWIAWDHPHMPWDSTQLRIGTLIDGVVSDWRLVLGAPDESVLQPAWVPGDPDHLYVLSDRSNWWNIYKIAAAGGPPQALAPAAEEFAGPLWEIGSSFFSVLDDGRLLVRRTNPEHPLGILDPATGHVEPLDLPFSSWNSVVHSDGKAAVGIGAGPSIPSSVVKIDLASGTHEILRQSVAEIPDASYLPQPRSITTTGPGRRDVHAIVYPPRNPDFVAPQGELPPYIVFVHGGPTSASSAAFRLEYAYFTSRGIGIIDVNYGGSTGYGRDYRERLRGQWGIVDVEDCVAAVEGLAAAGEADPARLAIRGGSAGGWTTLAALTRTKAFAAGVSYFGVAELLKFAHDTHDFESRYLDGLIGPLPEAHDVYVERAPLSHVDDVSCSVLLLQGLEDKVVPPSQAEMFRDALAAKGIRHAYLAFEGEQHGFRKAETVIAAHEAELSFYGQIFGFTPPGVAVLELS
ncbi:MAG: prolyl oligopeptidase family serine peptidase [Acidothermaceae bacterium]